MNLYFKLSTFAQVNELRKGNELKQNQVIEVNFSELTESQRSAITAVCILQDNELFFPDYRGYISAEVRNGKKWYSCGELNSMDAVNEIEKINTERKLNAEAAAKSAEKVLSDFNSIIEKFNSPDFRIYLQDKDGKSSFIHFEYKGVNFTPNWSNVPDIVQAIENKSIEKWINEVDESKAKKAKEAADREAVEEKRKAMTEAGRKELLAWANDNGSELLKLRIKHNQNWQTIAEAEWAVAHSVGFSPLSELCDIENDDSWTVKNGTIEQLKELEKAQEENPNHEITIERMKFVQKDNDEYYDEAVSHKTFLSCKIKTPVGIIYLFREINDVDDE